MLTICHIPYTFVVWFLLSPPLLGPGFYYFWRHVSCLGLLRSHEFLIRQCAPVSDYICAFHQKRIAPQMCSPVCCWEWVTFKHSVVGSLFLQKPQRRHVSSPLWIPALQAESEITPAKVICPWALFKSIGWTLFAWFCTEEFSHCQAYSFL